MTIDPTYESFFKALCTVIERDWRGRKGVLAQEADISGGYLSDILSRKRKASFKKQSSLAIAAGYTYEDFIDLGQKLLAEEDPGSLKKSSDTNLTKEVPSKEVKVGKKMEVEALKDLLQHYKVMLEANTAELSALREEIGYLRERNRELEAAKREAETQDKPSKPEKKTAV